MFRLVGCWDSMSVEIQSRKNEIGNASESLQASYKEFVERHQTTLQYMLQHGSAAERAKAETLIILAGG